MNNFKVLHSTVRDQAVEKLRTAISSGFLRPGQRLIERDLCDMCGVSRTSMREALRILEGEKLIVNVPHKGPSVAAPSPAEAKQIYEVRIELEALLGRDAAANATKAQVVALYLAVDLFDSAVRADDLGEMVHQADIFYSILFEMSGNTIVVDILQKLRARINTLRATSMSQRGRGSYSTKEMRAIANAVKRGDSELAATALVEHVRKAAAAALSELTPDSAAETGKSTRGRPITPRQAPSGAGRYKQAKSS